MVYNRVAAKFGPCGAQLGECGLVELGATWLHGVAGHPVYEAALRLGFMDGTERERASAPPARPLRASRPAGSGAWPCCSPGRPCGRSAAPAALQAACPAVPRTPCSAPSGLPVRAFQ